jgi:hypothetical protein
MSAERKARIEAMKQEIERRGGRVGTMAPLPDEILEMFLQQVLDCPDCDGGGDDPFRPKRRDRHGH